MFADDLDGLAKNARLINRIKIEELPDWSSDEVRVLNHQREYVLENIEEAAAAIRAELRNAGCWVTFLTRSP